MSFAHAADRNVVMTKTDPIKGARGISAFIIEKGKPGFSVIEKVPTKRLSGNLRGLKLQLNQDITRDLIIYLAIDPLTKQRVTAVPHIICMKILLDF